MGSCIDRTPYKIYPKNSGPRLLAQEAMCVSTRVFHKNTLKHLFSEGGAMLGKMSEWGAGHPKQQTPLTHPMKRLCLNG